MVGLGLGLGLSRGNGAGGGAAAVPGVLRGQLSGFAVLSGMAVQSHVLGGALSATGALSGDGRQSHALAGALSGAGGLAGDIAGTSDWASSGLAAKIVDEWRADTGVTLDGSSRVSQVVGARNGLVLSQSGETRRLLWQAAGFNGLPTFLISGTNAYLTLPGTQTVRGCAMAFSLGASSSDVVFGYTGVVGFDDEVFVRKNDISFDGSGAEQGKYALNGAGLSAAAPNHTVSLGAGTTRRGYFQHEVDQSALGAFDRDSHSIPGGQCAHLIWFNATLTTAERAEVDAHLVSEWGF